MPAALRATLEPVSYESGAGFKPGARQLYHRRISRGSDLDPLYLPYLRQFVPEDVERPQFSHVVLILGTEFRIATGRGRRRTRPAKKFGLDVEFSAARSLV